ncbi:MAG: hypothetical protein WKF71_09855 [Pyrinomonadaceae bacterium]
MSKSQKELAFLRDLYIETDWTERFTNIFDENFKFSGEKKYFTLMPEPEITRLPCAKK